jgi:putative PIN family toxin of toxin-antitoxin system
MRIVLDTNCLIQIVGRNTPYHKIFQEILTGRLILLLSKEVVVEYEEIFASKISSDFSGFIIKALLENPFINKVEIFYQWNLISQDPDDNKFIDLGLNGNADYLITNNKHFNIVKSISFPTLKIITLKDFFDLWIQEQKTTTP